jgi:hypothetical protein
VPANFSKDPGDILDYAFNWTSWLGASETISSSTWTATPTGITIGSNTFTTTQSTVWLSGGVEGSVYYVKNQIVTNQGRTVDRTMTIRVEPKGS